MKSMLPFEKFALPTIFAFSALGYGASWMMTNDAFAQHWISREDGLLEMKTFIALVAGAGLCLYRSWILRNERSKRFIAMLVLAAMVLIFGAGEEISWGQRMLGVETPEFFLAHNAQNETNLHNLVVGGVGINKLIFGKLLAVGLACYLIPLGLLFHRSDRFAELVNRLAIPVPRIYHAIAILAIVAVVETSPVSKRGEINEYAISSIAFLILLNPTNRKVFLSGKPFKRKAHGNSTQPTILSIADSKSLDDVSRHVA